ncbi:PEP-CTERM sorting domain-containing protein [Duganella rhizosphaerae]|uniref:PEP-CTERM sorting domain-containing protein n=1 Tax=Duganella rhizosphaerae TaxID=2885763 RepID=UPI00403F1A0E
MKTKTWCAAAASALLFMGSAHAQSYTFKDLNQSAISSTARGINNLGQIVGDARNAGNASSHATLWNGASTTDLGTLGGLYSGATAINSNGQISGTAAWFDYYTVAAVWQPGSGTAQSLASGTLSGALAINNSGQLAGWMAGPSGSPLATTWTGGTATALTTLGGTTSFANGINDHGVAVGFSNLAGDAASHATMWSGGTVTDLGTLGGTASYAQAINNNGQIVGASRSADKGNMHATLWDGNAIIDLGSLGGDGGWASAINNRGQIVGSSNLANAYIQHATLWNDGKVIDLNAFIDNSASAAGWVLTDAWGINDQGAIVGGARNLLTGEDHAFLLSVSAVPEPSTYAMLMLGLGLIGLTKSRRKS